MLCAEQIVGSRAEIEQVTRRDARWVGDSSLTQSLLQAIGYQSSHLCASPTPFSRAPKKSARKAQHWMIASLPRRSAETTRLREFEVVGHSDCDARCALIVVEDVFVS